MATRLVVLICTKCARKTRIDERKLSRVIDGMVKCRGCGALLEVTKGSLAQPDEDSVEGQTIETRENAILKVKKDGVIAIAKVITTGLRDPLAVRQFEEELSELLTRHRLFRIVLNFANLNFMSSSVMAVLIRVHNKAEAVQGAVVICNVAPDILKAFKIMRLDKILHICKGEHEAVAKIRKMF